MASSGNAGLSRVTIVAPRSRIDLAIPADIPLADLMPTLLRYAGDDLADDAAAPDGWALSRLGGTALDSSHTPAQLDVRDGELLYLRPRGDDAPKLVFDDVVDAVATATLERAGRWRPGTTRLFGLALGVVALLGGAAVVLFAGPPQAGSGLTGLAVAVALLATAVVFARALGDTRAGLAFALVGVVYAAVGGLLILAGDRTLDQLAAPHLLIATIAALLATTVAAVGVADAAPVFLGLGVGTVALFVAATICVVFGADPPAAAAIVVTVALGALPALPLLSYRLARLPIPTVPADPESLKQDTETVDGARVLELSGRADGFLAGMLGALAAIGGTAATVVVTRGDLPGLALCVALGLLLMSRARWFRTRVQRLPLLVAGTVALTAGTVAVFASVSPALRLTAVLGTTLAVAAISIGFGLAGGRPKASPMWGRIMDILEVLLILALIPLAVWVSGLYGWIRTIRG